MCLEDVIIFANELKEQGYRVTSTKLRKQSSSTYGVIFKSVPTNFRLVFAVIPRSSLRNVTAG